MSWVFKHELSPLWLPTLHSGSSPHCHASARGRSIFGKFLNAHLKFTVYGHKHGRIVTHTSAECSPASVGLAQAHLNNVDILS